MKPFILNFQRDVEQILASRERGEYEKALRDLEGLLSNASMRASSYLLTLRAELIQMINKPDADRYSLQDVENSLRQAMALDPSSVNARIELGCFLNSVQDKSAEAITIFEAAVHLCQGYLESAILGLIESTFDLEGPQAALAALEKAASEFPTLQGLEERKSFFVDAAARHQ